MQGVFRRIILSTLMMLLSVFGGLAYFFFFDRADDLEHRKSQYRELFINQQRQAVQQELSNAIEMIKHEHARVSMIHREALKQRVENLYNIAMSLYLNYQDRLPKEAIEELIYQAFSRVRWDNGSGYGFVLEQKGRVVLNPIDPSLEGKNPLKGSDPMIGAVAARILNTTQTRQEGFVTYEWRKPNDHNRTMWYEKTSYVKRFEPFDWVIGVGHYNDDVQKNVQKSVLERLRLLRYGHDRNGYFWVIDTDVQVLMHPFETWMEGQRLPLFRSSDGVQVFNEAVERTKTRHSAFFDYQWKRPSSLTSEQKSALVVRYHGWSWIIGTGFYHNDLSDQIRIEEALYQESLEEDIKEGAVIYGLLVMMALAIAFYMIRILRRQEEDILESLHALRQYKQVLDESSYVSKSTPKGIITEVNDAFCTLTGYERHELIGKPHSIFRHPKTPKALFRTMWNTINANQVWRGIVQNRTKTGESFYVKQTIVPISDAKGEIVEFIAARDDVTELVEKREELQQLFYTDSLTNLGNRFKLIHDINEAKAPMLAIIDIDGFKEINDFYGYKIGDIAIVEFGERLFEIAFPNHYGLYRLHADQYALFISQCDDEEAFIERITTEVVKSAKTPIVVQNETIAFNISIGIASGDHSLLIHADIALKSAKEERKNVVVYSDELQKSEQFRHNMEWTHKVKKALEEERIIPVFQPIYNTRTHSIEKFECLVRMRSESGELIAPFAFLGIAKKAKLYPEITLRMVAQSVEVFKELPYAFSLNVTIDDILNERVRGFLIDQISRSGIGERVVIELVESEGIEDFEEVLAFIQRVKALGAQIAIDDFGTGYSNFEYLFKLDADYIKIDGSLIKNIDRDAQVRHVTSAVVSFAKEAHMKTIAEYVATPEIQRIVTELGVEYLQGYEIGKPMDKEAFLAFIKTL